MTREEIVDLFLQNAAKAAAEPVRAAGREELERVLAEVLAGADAVYCPSITEIEKTLPIPGEKRTDDYRTASLCVQEVHGAIAETGSVINTSQLGKPVQAGLLPPHHVAIVSADHVYETLDDYFATVGNAPPTNITFETGPSRTADIELTLTIGVHGPGRLSIIVV